jgi:hypothetical protein
MAETKQQNRLERELDDRPDWGREEAWVEPDTLPVPNERPGWHHRYVRISMAGESDPRNISSKFREGYEPVKAEDYPELKMHATKDGPFKGGVEVGGLLLCRIPKERIVSRAKQHEQKNKLIVESVDNNYLRERDSRSNMAMIVERKSNVSFGSGS